jgi:hypothetical protein
MAFSFFSFVLWRLEARKIRRAAISGLFTHPQAIAAIDSARYAECFSADLRDTAQHSRLNSLVEQHSKTNNHESFGGTREGRTY